ncbi:hypothetical protein SODALDRAFT_275316 [Sodiomyces alkalinus F11]|uniref:DUF3835 domain-containing protein n=1 Tax=Sodiomyces alkalinus (strain CBS 110278 / VKM F-3762 / F11) TaxID=1314773 RepID=A0A3N2PZG2_SODAK|nr:hypothetical protein SODALDRAFT_275316 [Sodiomyces alkalinus F11]ROT39911.1 hypothetical protein SODALDRAFT_275316 [Sodiomyces alkalinus F11]
MSAVRDSFQDLEKQRLKLEENIAKLREGLQHWRQWDAEYETLKEEIESLPKPVSQKDIARIRTEFDGQVINKKEIDEIFGRIGTRPAEQIVNLVSRRIDYVTKNIETLEKQIQTAENKHAAVSIVAHPDSRDEDGLPITEIIEELDDDGNVVSSRLQTPGGSESQVRELLDKAGIKGLPDGEEEPSESESPSAATKPLDSSSSTTQQTSSPQPSAPQSPPAPPSQPSVAFAEGPSPGGGRGDEPASSRKGVLVPEDVKPADEPPISRAAQRVEKIVRSAKEQEVLAEQAPIIPEDESEEDAFLRREMLKYGMEEVGAVVAELTLEEGSGDDDDDDDDDGGFYESGYSDEEYQDDEEEEDKYGRYTGRVIDDEYRQRMVELEERLGVKSQLRDTQPAKDDGSDDSSDDKTEGLGRIVIRRDDQPEAAEPQTKPPLVSSLSSSKPTSAQRKALDGKKNVRFADTLDIAPDDVVPAKQDTAKQPSRPEVDPLSDVVERTGPAKQPERKADTPRKTSRFKKSLADAGPSDPPAIPKGPLDVPVRFRDMDRPLAPSGPEGCTVAESIVEKDLVPPPQDAAVDSDEEFIDQDLAELYHRKRRDFIQKHGGFVKEEESPIQPLDEGEGGQKMSRFRAARLSRQ